MEELYLKDSYQKEFTAKVISVEGSFVYLNQTCFYPNSGGQLNDIGSLYKGKEEFNVLFTTKMSGKIAHQIDKQGLKINDEAKGYINWQRRYTLMRMHTAAHVLSAIFAKEANALITGNQLDMEKSRIDFDLENFDRERINDYFNKANELIQKDLKVKVYEMSREEVGKNPEMVKLAKGLPPMINMLRIVEIDKFDRQPDGGTHVKSLKEVGKINFLKAENKGRSNRRVYFNLGLM